MEREQRERDRQPQGPDRTQEQPKEMSRDVASNIERCESRSKGQEGLSAPPSGSPPGDKPKDLQDRLDKDFQAIREIKGLNPDVWSKATEHDRMDTLRQVEKALASSQERKEHRTYAVPNLPDKGDEIIRENEAWIREDKVHSSKHWTATDGTHVQDRTMNTILIDEKRVQEKDPRKAFETLLEESRHAYQSAVLSTPDKNKYSEVDANTRELWEHGTTLNREHPELYDKNYREQDAKAYAAELTLQMYGKDRTAS